MRKEMQIDSCAVEGAAQTSLSAVLPSGSQKNRTREKKVQHTHTHTHTHKEMKRKYYVIFAY